MPLYTGVDLRNLKHDSGHEGHWQPKDWVLTYDGKSEAKDKNLWTEKEYGDFVLVCDWRLPAKPAPIKRRVILPNGDYAVDEERQAQAGGGDVTPATAASTCAAAARARSTSSAVPSAPARCTATASIPRCPPEVRAGCTPKERADNPLGQWNRFVITMKGDRLTVVLNGKTVIDNAQLPGIAPAGRSPCSITATRWSSPTC